MTRYFVKLILHGYLIVSGHQEIDLSEPISATSASTAIKITNTENTINVLIAEDNEINLLIAESYLKDISVNILSACNGQLAVDLFKSQDFDVILMDCQMPVMNGLLATKEIRQLELNRDDHTPIIAITANAFKDDQEACFAAGMDDFISKPYKKDQLLKAIELWTT
jgi:CheY-like chemotaxis protein